MGERQRNTKYASRENETSRGDGSSGHSPALADRCGKKVRDLGIYPGAAVPAKERKSRALLSQPWILSSCGGLQQLLLPMVGGRVRDRNKSEPHNIDKSLSASAQSLLLELSNSLEEALPP